MLSNAYFLVKFRFDTAENEPAKNLQKIANFANPNGAPRCEAEAVARRKEAKRDPERGAAPACPKGMVDLPLYRGEFGDEVRHLRAAPACDI